MTPLYSNLIANLFGAIDTLLNQYVYNGYAVLASNLKTPLGLAVVLYFCIMGISIVQGWVQMSLPLFVKSTLKIALIYIFAMNWENFSFYFVNGIEGSAAQIGDWLVNASPIPLVQLGVGTGINGALQSVLIEVTRVGAWAWQMGSFHDWAPYLNAIGIWIFGFCALVLAIIEIILAKMMLAILFTLAPLFISLTLFKPTRGMFDRWLGEIFGFSLFLIMIPVALCLALNLMNWSIGGLYNAQSSNINIVAWVPIMIVGILDLILIKNVASYAKSIGGGVSSAAGSSMLAAGVGGFIGGSLFAKEFVGAAGSLAKNTGANASSMIGNLRSKSAPIMESIRHKLRGEK